MTLGMLVNRLRSPCFNSQTLLGYYYDPPHLKQLRSATGVLVRDVADKSPQKASIELGMSTGRPIQVMSSSCWYHLTGEHQLSDIYWFCLSQFFSLDFSCSEVLEVCKTHSSPCPS
ncbi:hypothetical protein VTO42DRAFT_37 [Malbranchea cinnamomea]